MTIESIKGPAWKSVGRATIQLMVWSEHNKHMPYSYCCKVWELINDWYGDCNFVPENDAILLSVTLYLDEIAYPIEGIGLNDLYTFEMLMDALTSHEKRT